jgi:hypothetical protein
LQYTRNMRGVDSTDQLRGVYSCLTQSHKWWHRLFFYMLDTTVVNMWIIHSDLSFRFLTDPLTHMTFQLQLAKELAPCTWAEKHGQKKGVIAEFVVSGLIKHVQVAKYTFARDPATGTTTGSDFHA